MPEDSPAAEQDEDVLEVSSLLQMESPPVHLIVSGPVESENTGEYSKALRLYEQLETLLNERMRGSSVDRAMVEREEIKEIVSQEPLLCTAALALESALEGTPVFPDNFVLFLSQHFKRQLSLRKAGNSEVNGSSEPPSETANLEDSELAKRVKYGIVRNLLRLWRIDEGLQLMDNVYCIHDPKFFSECGDIVMQHDSYDIAGILYERGQNVLKAVEAFILAKDYNKAKEVLEKESSSDGWRLLAQAKEAGGELIDAARCYGLSGDTESGVKLYLGLNLPEEALVLVKKCREGSPSCAEAVADFFLNGGEGGKLSALEMLIKLGRVKEAANIAEKHGLQKALVEKVYRTYLMEKRVEIPQEFAAPLNEALVSLKAKDGNDPLECGVSFALLGNYGEAVPFLLRVLGDSSAQPDLLAERQKAAWAYLELCACNTKDTNLAQRIVEVMEGKAEGSFKNPQVLCDFFVLEKRWMDAAKVKKSLSEEFLRNGDVKVAYTSVVEGMRFLFRRDSDNVVNVITQEMSRDLVEYLEYFHILHSFRLMTIHTNLKSFGTAAYLAYRLRGNITRFPKSVQSLILSSGAMYAHAVRCGGIARELAVQLMKNKDLLSLVPSQHKSVIENIVRKTCLPSEVQKSCCPRCREKVDVWSLKCPNCAMFMPMCVISGKHLSAGDSTSCRCCHFPMNQSELEYFVRLGLDLCPICKDQMVSLPGNLDSDEAASLSPEEESLSGDDEPLGHLLSHNRDSHNPCGFTSFMYEGSPEEFYCDAEADERQMDLEMGTTGAKTEMTSRYPVAASYGNWSHPFAPPAEGQDLQKLTSEFDGFDLDDEDINLFD